MTMDSAPRRNAGQTYQVFSGTSHEMHRHMIFLGFDGARVADIMETAAIFDTASCAEYRIDIDGDLITITLAKPI
jgi:hypothetical protein